MQIVCDWDLVVAPLDVAWLEWLNKISGLGVKIDTFTKKCRL